GGVGRCGTVDPAVDMEPRTHAVQAARSGPVRACGVPTGQYRPRPGYGSSPSSSPRTSPSITSPSITSPPGRAPGSAEGSAPGSAPGMVVRRSIDTAVTAGQERVTTAPINGRLPESTGRM